VPARAELPSSAFSPVSAGYFETMGMRLVAGRVFDSRDRADGPKVIVVNETLARRLWPGEDAVGKRLKQGWPETPAPWREVIGVVGDVKLNGVAEETPMQTYLPLTQETVRTLAIVVRTSVHPRSIASAVEGAVHQIDKDLPLYLTRTMDEVLERSIAQQRMSMLVFAVFAVVALALASAGLYGVVAHGVTERTHEIGIRMALGAERTHVLALVIRQGLSMTLIGIVVGLAGAAALSKGIEGLLFGITADDPLTLVTVVAMLFTVAAAACYIPAWRATRVDPTQALRAE
jgi:putative ABC transport system permease protein